MLPNVSERFFSIVFRGFDYIRAYTNYVINEEHVGTFPDLLFLFLCLAVVLGYICMQRFRLRIRAQGRQSYVQMGRGTRSRCATNAQRSNTLFTTARRGDCDPAEINCWYSHSSWIATKPGISEKWPFNIF